MIYTDFKGKKLSMLGMGTMRLPVIDGNDSKIDEKAAAEMFDYAFKNGVNYFDTAYGYHGGQSEVVTGKILKNYPRDSFYIATKFPGYDLSNMDKVEEIFEKQLEKTGMEYFDFYMFHNVCEMNVDHYLDEKYGILDYLMKQKENGRIRHLGFSAHGDYGVMKRFLEKYGEHMEFCQLQINWIDWNFQDAKSKVELITEYNIPVWVMEPLRGGKLASFDKEYEDVLKEMRPDENIPAWAFRFLQSLPNVKVILSGMSNFDQTADNINTFKENKPLSDDEMSTLLGLAEKMTSKTKVPCTGCKYCITHCPQGIDIPRLIELYNEHNFTGGGFIAPMALSAIDADKQPSSCLGCRSCEQVCPQQISISYTLADFASKLG